MTKDQIVNICKRIEENKATEEEICALRDMALRACDAPMTDRDELAEFLGLVAFGMSDRKTQDKLYEAASALSAQQPVAWKIVSKNGNVAFRSDVGNAKSWSQMWGGAAVTPLYASPPPAPQQGPTEAPKWLVRASGDHYDTWLCVYRADVRNAIAEAIFGSIESAEEKEVDDYMKAIDLMPAEELSRRWNFEDGWLEVLRMAGK